jgi:hypothetical protein
MGSGGASSGCPRGTLLPESGSAGSAAPLRATARGGEVVRAPVAPRGSGLSRRSAARAGRRRGRGRAVGISFSFPPFSFPLDFLCKVLYIFFKIVFENFHIYFFAIFFYNSLSLCFCLKRFYLQIFVLKLFAQFLLKVYLYILNFQSFQNFHFCAENFL